jgi:two-component system phosphate regulon sensor histidine kinase PhoR
MFWRLFLTYLALILSVSALVGLLLFQGTDPRDLSPGTASRFLFTALLIALLAIGVAYLLARWVASPLDALGDGAQRLADGELGTSIPVKGPEASRRLARAFNAMSDRLAETFQESERDRERYRAILAGMAEGVVAIDRDQTIQFANRRAGELLEFDPTQAAGRKLWEVSRRPSIQDAVERAFAEPVAQRAELTWPGPKPRILTLSVARLPGDPPQGVVVVIDDATELRQLEQLRRDFVANV